MNLSSKDNDPCIKSSLNDNVVEEEDKNADKPIDDNKILTKPEESDAINTKQEVTEDVEDIPSNELTQPNSQNKDIANEVSEKETMKTAEELKEDIDIIKDNKKYNKKDYAEEFKYFVKNTDNGIIYDIRNAYCVSMLNDLHSTTPDTIKGSTPWEDWWHEKRELNNQLLNAVEKGSLEEVEKLLDEKNCGGIMIDINTKSLDDFTPLHLAVSDGYEDIVSFLLSRDAVVDSVTTSLRTPLHIACNRGNLNIIKILVEAKANINAQDADRDTPTHILSRSGYGEALTWFLKQQPDLSLKNMYKETAIEAATNIEIRQIFGSYTKVKQEGDYRRAVIDGVIRHNNRADMIKNFMFRAQILNTKKVEEIKDVEAKAAKEKKSSRVVKILQAAEKLKSIPPENIRSGKLKHYEGSESKDDTVNMEDFETYSLIGRGSFGEVYLVKYKRNGKFYAMKTLSKKRVMGQNLIRYAKTERNVLKISKHPFIVGLHFAFQNSEKLFMIMKYCPGYYPCNNLAVTLVT